MSQAEVVLVDSNVPMYAAGAQHEYREACQQVLARALAGDLNAASDVEVHQEILHRYLSLRLPEKAREVSEDFEALVPRVLDLSIGDIARARELSVHYPQLPARDLLHVAIMLGHGISSIVSADRHFDAVREVRRLDPRALVSGRP
jgi:predicted nucleic acid-binding protein